MVKQRQIIIGIVTAVVLLAVIITLSVVLTKSNDESSTAPVVSIDCGDIQGREVKAADGSIVQEFINIPYAKPPTGKLRWKPSELLEDAQCWDGVLKANKDPFNPLIACTQLDFYNVIPGANLLGQEDCLVLSVRVAKKKSTTKLPVIVWIHGGGLMMGWGETPGYGTDADFTIAMDAVTVNINYRLGALGFLTLEELWDTTSGKESYGNYGFMDQINALKWVQKNIEKFGGDPKSVTLIGESAGATSILSLVASPKADGLFHRAWAQSPATEFRYNYTEQSKINNQTQIPQFNCHRSTAAATRNCLYEMSANDIILKTVSLGGAYFNFPNKHYPLNESVGLAIVEPVVLPQAPIDAEFKRKTNITLVISNTAQESNVMPQPNYYKNWTVLEQVLTTGLARYNANMTFNDLFQVYPNETMALSAQWLWDTVVTDIRSTCPANRLASRMNSKDGYDIYRLYIENRPSTEIKRAGVSGNLAFHAWDSIAMFGFKGTPNWKKEKKDLEYEKMLKAISKALIHNTMDVGVVWKKFPENAAVINNDLNNMLQVKENFYADRCQMWNNNGFGELGWEN